MPKISKNDVSKSNLFATAYILNKFVWSKSNSKSIMLQQADDNNEEAILV